MKSAPLLLLLFSILFSACHTARRAQGGKLKPKSEKELMHQLLDHQVSVEWLNARAKIEYSNEEENQSFSANIRIRKDSAIWMSFKKFSIEGVRVLVTPDSVMVLDRLNNQYLRKRMDYLKEKYGLPLDFQGLQAVLLGNAVFFSSESIAAADSTNYILTQKTDLLEAKYYLDGTSLLLRRFYFNDVPGRQSMEIESSDYRPFDEKQSFSYVRRFNLRNPDDTRSKVVIEFTKVEPDVPQKLDFEIPANYERMD